VAVALVENEIRRLLATNEPAVISISGRWGVGKTFAWNKYLKEAQQRDTPASFQNLARELSDFLEEQPQ
jgi:hypothetical protein